MFSTNLGKLSFVQKKVIIFWSDHGQTAQGAEDKKTKRKNRQQDEVFVSSSGTRMRIESLITLHCIRLLLTY